MSLIVSGGNDWFTPAKYKELIKKAELYNEGTEIIKSSHLPSYVDDVVEVATYSDLPTTGESGKIYIVIDTLTLYRWTGTDYAPIALMPDDVLSPTSTNPVLNKVLYAALQEAANNLLLANIKIEYLRDFIQLLILGYTMSISVHDYLLDGVSIIREGTSAPNFTPEGLGLKFVDTTNKKIYESVGTSSASDWKALN